MTGSSSNACSSPAPSGHPATATTLTRTGPARCHGPGRPHATPTAASSRSHRSQSAPAPRAPARRWWPPTPSGCHRPALQLPSDRQRDRSRTPGRDGRLPLPTTDPSHRDRRRSSSSMGPGRRPISRTGMKPRRGPPWRNLPDPSRRHQECPRTLSVAPKRVRNRYRLVRHQTAEVDASRKERANALPE